MQKWAFYPYSAQASDTDLKDLKIFEDKNTKALAVAGYDAGANSIITSFRGSDNIMNWLEDADVIKTSYNQPGCSNCYVHKGFKTSYDSLKTDLNSYVSTLHSKYSTATVVVTGHSLGAAEAMLAAVDQQQSGLKVNYYSYGCPRVGDTSFAKFYNGLITSTNLRAVYRNDPVPTVPGHFLGFDHAGTEIHFYDCKNYLAYGFNKDDYPMMDLLAVDDHSSYRCLVSNDIEEELIEEELIEEELIEEELI